MQQVQMNLKLTLQSFLLKSSKGSKNPMSIDDEEIDQELKEVIESHKLEEAKDAKAEEENSSEVKLTDGILVLIANVFTGRTKQLVMKAQNQRVLALQNRASLLDQMKQLPYH